MVGMQPARRPLDELHAYGFGDDSKPGDDSKQQDAVLMLTTSLVVCLDLASTRE